jgi:hypothetical protein
MTIEKLKRITSAHYIEYKEEERFGRHANLILIYSDSKHNIFWDDGNYYNLDGFNFEQIKAIHEFIDERAFKHRWIVKD